METAATSGSPQPRQRRTLRRVGSAVLWTAAILLAAFGIFFSFANYPWFGAALVPLILLFVGYSEQKRRTALKVREAARTRSRQSAEASEEQTFIDC